MASAQKKTSTQNFLHGQRFSILCFFCQIQKIRKIKKKKAKSFSLIAKTFGKIFVEFLAKRKLHLKKTQPLKKGNPRSFPLL